MHCVEVKLGPSQETQLSWWGPGSGYSTKEWPLLLTITRKNNHQVFHFSVTKPSVATEQPHSS